MNLEHLSKVLKVIARHKAAEGSVRNYAGLWQQSWLRVFASLQYTSHYKQVVIFTMALCRDESKNLSTCRPNNDSLEISSTLPVSLETTSSANLAEDSVPVEATTLSTYTTCALFGVIGNLLVIIILKKLRGKKTRMTDFFLINLAIVDLGYLLLTFPMGATRERVPFGWPFGKFVCLYL